MSGGFFRGTSAEQDTRFSNKQAKLLKTQRFAAELENPVDMTRVKMDVIKPWIATRATELLGFEDEVLINFVYELLDGKEVDGKQIQIQLTGFLEKNTGKFMKELWALLLSAQNNASGVPQQFLDAKEEEMKKRKVESDRITQEIQKRKEKEGREYEQEKKKRMDVESGNLRSANAVSGSSSRFSLPRDSRIQSEKDREMEAVQSPRLKERRTPSPSRSLSKSPKSGNSKDGRSRSVSVSSQSRGRSVSPLRKDPSSRRSMSSERQYKSPVRRSITPRRRYSPQRNRSPSRHISPHSRRRSPSIPRHRSPSPMRRRSPYGRRSPSRRRFPIKSHRGSPSPLLQRRSPSPGRRRGSPSARRRRSPSPARRRRSPSPLHRRRSPSPAGNRRSPSPALHRRSPGHRRGSPSSSRRRNSPSPAHCKISPSPARRRTSPSSLHHRISRSPPHHRKSPSPAHQRTSTSPARRRSPIRNRSLSAVRRRSMSPPRRSSPKRSLNSSRNYDADSQISARAKKRNHSPYRSSSSSDLDRIHSSRETDSRSNVFDTKKYQEECASERPSEKRPLVHDALHREVAERSGSKRGALDRVPRQLAGAPRSPCPDSRGRDDILDKDHGVPSENSSERSGSPSYSRRTRSLGRDRQPGSTEKRFPRDISRMNGDMEQASLARDNAYHKTDFSSKKGIDSSENIKKKRFYPNEFDEEEYTNNGLAIDHSPGNQDHPSNINFRKESERKSEVNLPKRDAGELSGSGDDMEYAPGKPMSRSATYKDSHHEADTAKKSKRRTQTSSQAASPIHPDSEEEADTRKHKSGEKRKQKKSDKHRRERDSDDSSETESDIEGRKEAKRRRKEREEATQGGKTTEDRREAPQKVPSPLREA